MPSKQAMEAAQNIASWMRLEAHQFPSDGNVAEWSEMIDAAFAPTIAELVGLLREARVICGDLSNIMAESRGVCGYRWDGEEAMWDEFADLLKAGAVFNKIDAAIARHGGEA